MTFDGWWRWREKRDHAPEVFPASMAWLLENPLSRLLGRRALRHVGLERGMRVLDAGCGPGRFTIPTAEAVGPTGEVVAFDLQHAMLARVERHARERGLGNVRTLQGAAGEGSLDGEDAFDSGLLVSVLGEVPEGTRGAALREIRDALRPGGVLVVVEGFSDPDYLSPGTVRRLAESAGFEPSGERRSLLGYTAYLRKPTG